MAKTRPAGLGSRKPARTPNPSNFLLNQKVIRFFLDSTRSTAFPRATVPEDIVIPAMSKPEEFDGKHLQKPEG